MNTAAGEFDRRIIIQRATETQDAAGDTIQTWADDRRLWARKRDGRGREFFGAEQMVRDADTVFAVRSSGYTRAIAPETHRVSYKGATFEIVAKADGNDREDVIELLTCSRPDARGERARTSPSG
jgi:SPP1 family predicted phage head-tail adaptor